MKVMVKKKAMMTTKATTDTRSEHGKQTITFSKLVNKLQQHYGAPVPPPSTDPLDTRSISRFFHVCTAK
jgi:hypothetical protein